jgi:transcription antitermination factor NusG
VNKVSSRVGSERVTVSLEFESGSKRWYVARTRPHSEFKAGDQLTAQGFGVFLPVCLTTVRHARRFRTAQSPLFSNYIFIEFDDQRDRWRSINGTRGVDRLVMAGEVPVPVPRGVVEELRATSNADGMITFESDLRTAEWARVLCGPFAGLTGRLLGMSPSGRVQVLFEIMGCHVSVLVGSEALAPVA